MTVDEAGAKALGIRYWQERAEAAEAQLEDPKDEGAILRQDQKNLQTKLAALEADCAVKDAALNSIAALFYISKYSGDIEWVKVNANGIITDALKPNPGAKLLGKLEALERVARSADLVRCHCYSEHGESPCPMVALHEALAAYRKVGA